MEVETCEKICSFFTRKPYTAKYYLWPMVILIPVEHMFGLFGAYIWLRKAVLYTSLYYIFIGFSGGVLGITVGAHRLWTHKSFKANLPLRIFLMLANCVTGHMDVIKWVRWHRTHHKWTDTNADPHSIKRGFFFAHIGWLMVKPHPDYVAKSASIDLTDLYADPVLKFQAKYYVYLVALCWLLTAAVPIVCWGEDPLTSLAVLFTTFVIGLHIAFSVNSVVHLGTGTKPYDPNSTAVNFYFPMMLMMGEGYHNFHHAFPMDYRAAEPGSWFNLSLPVIHFFAWLGWATDLKSTPLETIEKYKKNAKNISLKKSD